MRQKIREDPSPANVKHVIKESISSRRAIDTKDIDLFVIKIVAPVLRKSISSRGKNMEIVSPFKKIDEELTQFQGKLDFNQFLKVLEYVALRTYPELDEDIAIQYLVEKNLAPLMGVKTKNIEHIDSKEHLKRLMEILKEESVVRNFEVF